MDGCNWCLLQRAFARARARRCCRCRAAVHRSMIADRRSACKRDSRSIGDDRFYFTTTEFLFYHFFCPHAAAYLPIYTHAIPCLLPPIYMKSMMMIDMCNIVYVCDIYNNDNNVYVTCISSVYACNAPVCHWWMTMAVFFRSGEYADLSAAAAALVGCRKPYIFHMETSVTCMYQANTCTAASSRCSDIYNCVATYQLIIYKQYMRGGWPGTIMADDDDSGYLRAWRISSTSEKSRRLLCAITRSSRR